MSDQPEFLKNEHNPEDPSPWLASYLDQSTPLPDEVKQAWLEDSSSSSRQYLLPFLRPLARLCIILIQVVKTFLPRRWAQSALLHRILVWGLKRFVSPQANWLILRHFHLGSQILAFIAANSPAPVSTNPLEPETIDDLKDHVFVKHDINLYNFVIRLNQALLDARTRSNVLDLQSAIELFTPLYQLLLTDNDFWRAANSLQLDETIGIYAAQILQAPEHLMLVNNHHPLVPLSTLRAGHRLVLHGLSSEMLHCLLLQKKREYEAKNAYAPATAP
jgi:hypothetical protein